MRAHPHLYEINTWPWLESLSRRYGRRISLGSVPDEQWDALRDRGMDLVYLMGVWRRSAFGREIALSDPGLRASYDRVLPGWRAADVIGSAYCITAYEPDPHLGTMRELDDVRARLHARGMQLIVDFIPNHVGFDHPWVFAHPDRFVNATEDAVRRDPAGFRAVQTTKGLRMIACARDPYFPPWTDVAQLDYSKADTREAMIRELGSLAEHADGARCDMAMLVLSDVFAHTWGDLVTMSPPGTEFWAGARAAVPGFLLLAEVYWDLEYRLQQLGFDFTYDKRLYDRLLHGSPDEVRGHLRADGEYQRRSVRFIENHDEPRSAAIFQDRVMMAAVAVSTLPGMRFYYDGQVEGRRTHLPVQLGVQPDEPIDERLAVFYARLLSAVDEPIFHSGAWRLCGVAALDDSSRNLAAWRWRAPDGLRVVVVNLGPTAAQGQVEVTDDLLAPGEPLVFEDQLAGIRYRRGRRDLAERGLYVRLEQGQAHLFAVRAPQIGDDIDGRNADL